MRASLLADAKQTTALLISMLHHKENEAFAATVRSLTQEQFWAIMAYAMPAILQHVYNIGEKVGMDNEQAVQSFCLDVMKSQLPIE